MEELNFSNNKDIDDDVGNMFLNCISRLKNLNLFGCNLSLRMQIKLFERGK